MKRYQTIFTLTSNSNISTPRNKMFQVQARGAMEHVIDQLQKRALSRMCFFLCFLYSLYSLVLQYFLIVLHYHVRRIRWETHLTEFHGFFISVWGTFHVISVGTS